MGGRRRPIGPGPDVIAAADGVSTPVAVGAATSFWVIGSAAFWIVVSNDGTVITPMDETNSTLCAGTVLYGGFDLMPGYDTYIHVAGAGGASNVTITLA